MSTGCVCLLHWHQQRSLRLTMSWSTYVVDNSNHKKLDRRLRAHLQDKLVRLGVDNLLGHVEVGQGVDLAEQGHVPLPQLEGGARADHEVQRVITDQGPRLHVGPVALVLKQQQ